jgi:hypothetical protein
VLTLRRRAPKVLKVWKASSHRQSKPHIATTGGLMVPLIWLYNICSSLKILNIQLMSVLPLGSRWSGLGWAPGLAHHSPTGS